MGENGYCAVSQILNDNFFQNPAELSLINKSQVIGGNIFINPFFNFNGSSYGISGSVNSSVFNYLPYMLSAYRFTDKFVLGFSVLPSAYGHLNWGENSIVSQDSTQTEVLYYRFSFQAGYQINANLSLGIGFNLEDNAHYHLNFVVPGQGNQVNSVSGLNYTGDFGLYYKINAKNYLTIAMYTQVNTYGHGTSSTASVINNNLSLNITQAPIVYAGLQSFITDKWFMENKLYWSGWHIQRNINFTNTTTGSYSVPTDWRDVWSFQSTTTYKIADRVSLIGSGIYETNTVPSYTNAIGYPLAASGSLSGGFDILLKDNLSIQVVYSYGAFLPDSPINSENSIGTINAHFQAGTIQFVYKT